jgi:hypothetical protein
MPNFHTAEALRKFRAFRRHQQFTAARARRTPEVPFVQVIHGHTDLERHDDPSVRESGIWYRFCVSSSRWPFQQTVKDAPCICCIFGAHAAVATEPPQSCRPIGRGDQKPYTEVGAMARAAALLNPDCPPRECGSFAALHF